jgi:CBS-domain-containing membrane protein
MEIFARDVMTRDFETIRDDAPIKEAVHRILHGNVRQTGHKTISLIVIDEFGRLEGVISIFDILYHFRPDFLNYGLDSIETWVGRLRPLLDQFQELTVEQVMSSPVMTVSPDDHLMVIIDKLVKKKLRRLPVVDGDKVVGVVYLYDAYYHLFHKWCE